MSMDDFSKIKKALAKEGKSLDIHEGDDALAVACFLADLQVEFNTIVEDDDVALDPYTEILESQYTKMHQLFRRILKRDHGFCFKEADFRNLKHYTGALTAGLLGVGLYEKLEKHKKDEKDEKTEG